MADNLWQIITGNSSLPVQSGNNLWGHFNSQQGGGSVLGGRSDLEINAENNVLTLSDGQEKITIKSGSGGISMKADKTGLNV